MSRAQCPLSPEDRRWKEQPVCVGRFASLPNFFVAGGMTGLSASLAKPRMLSASQIRVICCHASGIAPLAVAPSLSCRTRAGAVFAGVITGCGPRILFC